MFFIFPFILSKNGYIGLVSFDFFFFLTLLLFRFEWTVLFSQWNHTHLYSYKYRFIYGFLHSWIVYKLRMWRKTKQKKIAVDFPTIKRFSNVWQSFAIRLKIVYCLKINVRLTRLLVICLNRRIFFTWVIFSFFLNVLHFDQNFNIISEFT